MIKNAQSLMAKSKNLANKYNIIAILDNLKVNLSIDIATGDVITTREIEYSYIDRIY